MEEGIFDAVHEQDDGERRVRGQSAAQKRRAGNVRVQVGQDHVDQVRQPFGPRRTVSVNKCSRFGSTRRQWVPARRRGTIRIPWLRCNDNNNNIAVTALIATEQGLALYAIRSYYAYDNNNNDDDNNNYIGFTYAIISYYNNDVAVFVLVIISRTTILVPGYTYYNL